MFKDSGGTTIATGELWLHKDTAGDGHYSVALVLPLTLKDSTYGANVSAGYSQTFKNLVGSDKAVFSLEDTGGSAITDLRMDYLHGVPDKEDGPDFQSGFNTGAEGSGDLGKSPGDGGINTNGINAATSMQYNFDQALAAAILAGGDENSADMVLSFETARVHLGIRPLETQPQWCQAS